jgi:hypothetical protein
MRSCKNLKDRKEKDVLPSTMLMKAMFVPKDMFHMAGSCPENRYAFHLKESHGSISLE